MPSARRYHRCVILCFVAFVVNLLFLSLTKPLVSLHVVSKSELKQTSALRPTSPIQIPISTSVELNHWGRIVSPSNTLLFALEKLASQAALIESTTNTYTINQRIHPIVINPRNAYWNPSIVSLPANSATEYLLVARVLTNGLYQQTIICQANWMEGEGLLKCVGEESVVLDIPPTAARLCGQANSSAWAVLSNIPGLHDGRLMWTDKGELLMIGGTQSRFTCFSLSLLTISSPEVYEPLHRLLPDSPISYRALTELRRPPPYAPMEKNWLLFFSPDFGTYAQYELAPGKRTFAKLIGNGYVTQNLTSIFELPCLGYPYPLASKSDIEHESKSGGFKDGWHQATNSLRLILCDRRDFKCQEQENIAVFIAVVQRKRHNPIGLVSRYERVAVMWEGEPPFRVLAVGKARMVFEGEEWPFTSTKAAMEEVRNGDSPATLKTHSTDLGHTNKLEKHKTRQNFTFMVSLAFDHVLRRKNEGPNSGNGENVEEMYMGYLDDFVIAGMGIGDEGMGVVRFSVRELLVGIAVCPGPRN